MSPWTDVNTKEINTEKTKVIKGVDLHVYMSPYDIPQAFRHSFDDVQGLLVIEFKYLNDEPLRKQEGDGFVSFYIGKNSRRLFKIYVNVKALNAQKITLHLSVRKQLEATMGRLKTEMPKRRDNYDVIGTFLEKHSGFVSHLQDK